jgi:hypothetical protein
MADYEIDAKSIDESKNTTRSRLTRIFQKVIIHTAVAIYLFFAILKYIKRRKFCCLIINN